MVLEHKVKVCDITDISNSVGLPCVKIQCKTIRKRSCVQAFGQNCARPEVRRDVYFDTKVLGVVLPNSVNWVSGCLPVCLSVCLSVCSVSYIHHAFVQNEHYLEYETNPCQIT